MAISGKIEELQKKFDENPRRYFAPLANEYRKLGDLEQAIAICREHLPRQPGHMSGHIVYGQSLFDAREFDEAKTVFEMALTLDPENLIALRHLGDIALQAGDADAAKGWYQRGLDADPRNEEMAARLASASSAGSAPSPFSPPEPAIEPVGAEPAQPATPAPEASPPPPPVESAASVWGSPADETPTLIMERFPRSTPASPPSAVPPEGPSEALELEDDLTFDIPTAAPPRASDGRGRSAFGVELDRVDDAVLSVPPQPPASLTTPPAFPEFSLPAESESPPPAAPPSDPFATETMAELYLSQGHYADALRVYRELEEQRPADAGLQAKIARVESLMAATPVLSMPPVPEFMDTESAVPEATAASGPDSDADNAGDVPELDASGFTMPAEPMAHEAPPEPAAPADAGPTIRQFLGALAMRTPYAGNLVQAEPEPPAPYAESTGFVEVEEQPVEEEVFIAEFDVALEEAAPEEVAPDAGAAATSPDASEAVAEAMPAVDDAQEARPSGSIDALFGGTGASKEDLGAAHVLASAFARDEEMGTSEAAPMSGSPARRASHELSLDTVFRDDAHQTPPPAASFSFDQFFAAPTPAAGTPVTHPTPGVSGPATADDIEQFNSWLQGLKKR